MTTVLNLRVTIKRNKVLEEFPKGGLVLDTNLALDEGDDLNINIMNVEEKE